MKKYLARALVTGVILAAGATALVFADYWGRHPNLSAARDNINMAINAITAAQQSNEFDLNGHAQAAKNLLFQAREEVRRAAIVSDRRGKY